MGKVLSRGVTARLARAGVCLGKWAATLRRHSRFDKLLRRSLIRQRQAISSDSGRRKSLLRQFPYSSPHRLLERRRNRWQLGLQT